MTLMFLSTLLPLRTLFLSDAVLRLPEMIYAYLSVTCVYT